MFTEAEPILFRAITPVHAGSGQDLGIVDMPIQREKHSGIPKIEGSGVKGAFREYFNNILCKNQNKDVSRDDVDALFGPERGNEYAATLGFTDARLLFFPVRSLKGIFALVTCPYILERLLDDLSICNKYDENSYNINELKDIIDEIKRLNMEQCYLYNRELLSFENRVFLEEHMFSCKVLNDKEEKFDDFINELNLEEEIKNRIVILTNETFIDFVIMNTEIITRNKINNETGTTDDAALFTEEYLPAESILYTLVMASDRSVNKKQNKYDAGFCIEKFMKNKPELMQIGGNATIGKGIVQIRDFQKGDKNDQK